MSENDHNYNVLLVMNYATCSAVTPCAGMKKKGLGSTPEASLGGSSHTSTSSAGQDNDGFLDEVLRGEDIDALRIKEDNLAAMVNHIL